MLPGTRAVPSRAMRATTPGAETRRFGRHAGLLSAGVAASGLLTYLFFSLAGHNLSAHEYGEITVLWSAVFVTISVAHRPVELLLSRTLAERRANGRESRVFVLRRRPWLFASRRVPPRRSRL